MRVKKKPRFKSVENAEKRIRLLERRIQDYEQICTRMDRQIALLAKLSATGPAFFNPLEAMAAETLRDEVLTKLKLNPDGSPIASF